MGLFGLYCVSAIHTIGTALYIHTTASMVGNRENSLSASIPTVVALLLVSEEKTEENILTDVQKI